MKNLMLYLISILFLLSLTQCSDEPNGPQPPVITSHEFVWEVDTIPSGFFQAKKFYGTSSTNLYMAGRSTALDDMSWHWNGEQWSLFNPERYWTTRDLIDVDGVDSSFIVFTGHNDGPKSKLAVVDNGVLRYIKPPDGVRFTTCLRVVSRNEIYLAGSSGVQKYNGTDWEWLLDSTDSQDNGFQPQYIYKFPDATLELVALRVAPGEKTKLFQFQYVVNQFTLLDTFTVGQTEETSMHFGDSIQKGYPFVLATGYGGTYVREGSNWTKIHEEGGAHITGSLNNMIIGKHWFEFWHYNGDTMVNLWDEMKVISPTLNIIHAAWFKDGVLFVAGELEGSRTCIVLRGMQSQD